MLRYVTHAAVEVDQRAVIDMKEQKLVGTYPPPSAKRVAHDLNNADRVERMRAVRWGERKLLTERDAWVVKLREVDKFTFARIAEALGVSPPLVHRIYHREIERRALVDGVGSAPITDDTPLDDVRHLIPTKVMQSLKDVTWGLGKPGTVGMIRKTPDDVLRAAPRLGAASVTRLRAVFGYADEYQNLSVREFLAQRQGPGFGPTDSPTIAP